MMNTNETNGIFSMGNVPLLAVNTVLPTDTKQRADFLDELKTALAELADSEKITMSEPTTADDSKTTFSAVVAESAETPLPELPQTVISDILTGKVNISQPIPVKTEVKTEDVVKEFVANKSEETASDFITAKLSGTVSETNITDKPVVIPAPKTHTDEMHGYEDLKNEKALEIVSAAQFVKQYKQLLKASQEIIQWMNIDVTDNGNETEEVSENFTGENKEIKREFQESANKKEAPVIKTAGKHPESSEFVADEQTPEIKPVIAEKTAAAISPQTSEFSNEKSVDYSEPRQFVKQTPVEPFINDLRILKQQVIKSEAAAVDETAEISAEKDDGVTSADSKEQPKNIDKDIKSAVFEPKAADKPIVKPIVSSDTEPEKSADYTTKSSQEKTVSAPNQKTGETTIKSADNEVKKTEPTRNDFVRADGKEFLKSGLKADQSAPKQTSSVAWDTAEDIVKLAKLINNAAKAGVSKLTVHLQPANLGKIEIALTDINGRIDAKLVAQSSESRDFFLSHGDAIVKQLAEKGIHIDNMDFRFHDAPAKEQGDRGSKGRREQANQKRSFSKPQTERIIEGLYA
jgi:flagellar hook-length control protein FliK